VQARIDVYQLLALDACGLVAPPSWLRTRVLREAERGHRPKRAVARKVCSPKPTPALSTIGTVAALHPPGGRRSAASRGGRPANLIQDDQQQQAMHQLKSRPSSTRARFT
jgi:hypothetical protein